jgi:thymidylate synthase (FAD)
MTVVFRSDIVVKVRRICVFDEDVATAAWVSSGVETEATDKRVFGVENALMRDRHGSPFDEGYLSVYVEAPRAVRDEWVRHRNLSYSSSSLRYKEQGMEFYVPPQYRPIKKADGHKQIRPKYDPLTDEEYELYTTHLKTIYEDQAFRYEELRAKRPETEAVRWVTNDGLYTPFIVRGLLRPWLQFLQLRTHEETANHVSYPMFEIEEAARQVEQILVDHAPLTMQAWNENGRDI